MYRLLGLYLYKNEGQNLIFNYRILTYFKNCASHVNIMYNILCEEYKKKKKLCYFQK